MLPPLLIVVSTDSCNHTEHGLVESQVIVWGEPLVSLNVWVPDPTRNVKSTNVLLESDSACT
jgi:hypothetical protein